MNVPVFSNIVSSSNTDKNGNMKLFSAVQWMQDCSVISFMEDTAFCEWLGKHGATPVVSFRQLEVLRVPQPRPVAAGDTACKALDSTGWSYSGFAAEQAALAFDSKPDTLWSIDRCPSHFVVDMKKEYSIDAFAYLPRQDGQTQGMTSRYRLETSTDAQNWTTAAEGEFGNLRANPIEQHISFPPQKARYLRFFSTAALDGTGSSVAELKIYGK